MICHDMCEMFAYFDVFYVKALPKILKLHDMSIVSSSLCPVLLMPLVKAAILR